MIVPMCICSTLLMVLLAASLITPENVIGSSFNNANISNLLDGDYTCNPAASAAAAAATPGENATFPAACKSSLADPETSTSLSIDPNQTNSSAPAAAAAAGGAASAGAAASGANAYMAAAASCGWVQNDSSICKGLQDRSMP